MTDALKELREKVAAGTLTHIGGEHTLAAMPRETWEPIVKANSGSIDAAKALSEAVLPGWSVWGIYQDTLGHWCVTIGQIDRSCRVVQVGHDYLARAWLLAIFDALIAREADQ
jgi:hypothetical protein